MINTQKSQLLIFKISSEHELTIENLKRQDLIFRLQNMVMFDHEGRYINTRTLNGIMQRFCKERIKIYEKRRTVHVTEAK